ncbi:hypothetical protein [Flavobacterium ginsenosidimutans]|uniref:Uncharacterized protein n=1 Tax=Flavobacterium ginsenosidimutans TaxID=687844 RepID=A0ABZ2Q6U7_9FLAO
MYKGYVISKLRKSFKKDQKKADKKLAQAEKGSTFAPATAKGAHRNTGRKEESEEKKFSEKRFGKACGI